MPPAERRALLSLLMLAVAGQGVRYLLSRPGEPPGEVQLLATLSPGSPRAQRDSAMQQGRPLRPGEKIDLDRATVAELNRLPRIGPRLAKVILANRTEQGPFGSMAGLDRVPGVGPGLLKTLEPYVVFSGAVASLSSSLPAAGTSAPLNINSATLAQLDSLPGVGPSRAAAILRYREEHGSFTNIDQLEQVPGVGPAAFSRMRDRLTTH